MNVPVSIIIPTRNEAHNIERCLKSILWASEIYVVDSGSADETCQIAKNYGAKIVQFEYRGGWPKEKGTGRSLISLSRTSGSFWSMRTRF